MPSKTQCKRSSGPAWEQSTSSDDTDSTTQSPDTPSDHINTDSFIEEEPSFMMDETDIPWWRIQEEQRGEEIVISGISGRFPDSDTIEEFSENLYSGKDLLSEDDRRWAPGFYDLPKKHGKLKQLNRFDAQFFGVVPKQANYMDPQIRILLEVAYEAIMDAGINPISLRGSRTGVFVGCSASETAGSLTQDPENVVGYTLTGCTRSMFANRLSFALDLRGPSFAVDTACSSSLLALQLAVDAIRQDQCDAAVVAGAHLTLLPTSALQFLKLNMLSPQGMSQSFDENADGYARGEGIAAILLQKSSVARRSYTTVVHAKSNTDGYKEQGITFPSGNRQAQLLEEVYREAQVDPNNVVYVETHGTGTKVGDPQEANAITEVFCSNRQGPLLIGSVKSNMGHAEPASGLAAIAKVIISMEKGIIAPNLHFNLANPYIPGLSDGRMKVVTEPTPWNGGLVGINSFGFGGSNTHVLLRSHPKSPPPQPIREMEFPKIIMQAGRTQEACETMIKAAQQQSNPYFHELIADQAHIAANLYPYRGFTLLNRKDHGESTTDIQKVTITEPRECWFVYSGMGTQWAGMGQELMCIEPFKESVLRCSEALRPLGVDPYSLIMKGDEEVFKNTMNCMVCITAIQIALTDILNLVGVQPDGIIGHSTGEMACGYADGCLTTEQTMLCAYYRGHTILNGGLNHDGGMAAIGLTWEDAKKRVPEGVIAACHNGYDSVTVSGDYDKVMKFVDELKAEEVFAKFVNSSGVAFHSPKMAKIKPSMTTFLKEVIPEPKPRSDRWVSSSIPEEESESALAQTCSAEYQVNNALSPVLFYEALQKVPKNAITIELAPHGLMQAILRRTLPSTCANISLMKARHAHSLEFFLQSMGHLYQANVPVNAKMLYSPVPKPVPSGTPMISPFVKWDHSQDWQVVNAKDFGHGRGGGVASSCTFTIEPHNPESKEQYVIDHVIDGRNLYPFTGHIVMAWKALCKIRGLDILKTPVILDDVSVYRPTIISKGIPIKFDVVLLPESGQFEVMENESVAASGRITIVEGHKPFFYEEIDKYPPSVTCERVELTTADVYKEFQLRGYEYGPSFQGIQRTCNSGDRGTLFWTGNWVTFLDSLLQTALLAERADTLRLPVRLRYLRIDPEKHLNSIEKEGDIDVIHLRNDANTRGCVAGGVETCELTAQTVPRRLNTSGRVYHERIYFMKHHDDSCFDEFTAIRDDLAAYKQLCQAQLAQGLAKWKEMGVLKALPNGAMFQQALEKLPKDLTIDKTFLDSCLESQFCTLAQYYNRLFGMERGEEDMNVFIANMTNLARDTLPTLDLDKLWTAAFTQQRPIKPLLDISMENNAGHFGLFCWLEPVELGPMKYLIELQLTHPLLQMDWVVLGPNVDSLDNQFVDKFGVCHKVDIEAGDKVPETAKEIDVLVADKVLGRKIDIPRFLERLKEILRDNAVLLISEITNDFELAFGIDGMLGSPLPASGDGARKYGSYMTHDQWVKTFEQAGFYVSCHQTDPSMSTTLYLLHKKPSVPYDPYFISVDDITEFSWIEPLQQAIEERLTEGENKPIWVTSTEVRDNGTVGLALSLREENTRVNRFRSIVDVSLTKREGPAELTMENPIVQRAIDDDLHANNFRDGHNGSFRHLVVKEDEMHSYMETEHAFINTLVRGDLSSLAWVESGNQYWDLMPKRKETQRLLAVYYAPINFRDVMLATGRLPPDAIPGHFADRDCLLGMEFSGRLTDTGLRVMGMLPAQALATTVVVDTEFSWEVPDSWSLEAAATVPVVYCTAFYALIIRGRIRRGDKVLIHSGSGGVGQASITVALAMGCEVFTTVGTAEKKAFLQKRFPQLQDKHFSNSRSTEFEWHIRQVTNGRGVDLVLNSLSEDKLQASLRCLAQHGRFLEIGKFDLSNNTALGMAFFLKNVTFHGILLDALMDSRNDDWQEVAQLLRQGIKSGVVQPLPATCFTGDEVEDAFRYMGSGKHIGKVLIQIRPEEDCLCIPRPIKVRAVRRTLCNPQQVYLITGGLGGFGLELAQFLINRGAKKLVLTSRQGIRTGYQARCIYFWRRTGISILVSTLNIAEEDEAHRLIKQCQELGPIGGVFHLAMVLRDCLFENQHVQNFTDAAQAKYWGTKHLDKATRELCGDELKWFVAFSSITSGRGNAGQTNYGWANSTLERVVEMRRADDLPGIAIQWGAIGDVGVVLENMGDNTTIIGGTWPQRMPSCLQSLDMFISWNHPIVSCFVRAELGVKKTSGAGGDVLATIAHILGVSDVSQLDLTSCLGDLGLDSLMGVEIKQALERDFDIVLSMKDIRTLTLSNLKEMADAGGGVAARDIVRDNSTEREVDDVTLEELEIQMAQLFKLRIDVNDLLATDTIVQINNVKEGTPVFFVHSIEGIGTPLMRLAEYLPFPCYCFQCTPTVPLESITSMAAHYIDIMKKTQPIGPYRLVGYSYGACIAFEMAGLLQSEKSDAIEQLVLLDGSHHYMKTYRDVYRRSFGFTGEALANNPMFESEVMCAFTLRFANVDYKTFRLELLQAPNWKGRVQKVVDAAMKTGIFKSPDTLEWACEALRAKFLCADKYDPKHKFYGNLILIRAEQTAGRFVGHDYGITEVATESQVFVVDGDHDGIVQGESSHKTAEILQQILNPHAEVKETTVS